MIRARFAVAGLALSMSAVAHADLIAFDTLTGVTNFNVAAASNTFLGAAVNLGAAAITSPTLTGVDATLINTSGVAQIGALRLNVFVWGTFTSATTPVFSNSLGNATFNFGNVNLANNSVFLITDALNPGITPGLTFTTPIAITGTTGLGFTFNWQINTGAGFANVNNLTSAIRDAGIAPVVGTNAAGISPNFGYYRNASGRTDGNFASTDLRQIGPDSNIAFRVYVIPTPSAAALIGMGGLLAARRRRA